MPRRSNRYDVWMEPEPTLLDRSEAFADHLDQLVDKIQVFNKTPRAAACADACELSIEHAHAVRVLFATGAPSSACAMLRTQYEAVVRGAWATHVATDLQIEKLNQPLGSESEQAAKNLPGAQDMLIGLKKRVVAEPGLNGLVVPLLQIHEVSWRAMNSYVHGGIHPLQRTGSGFPAELAAQVVRNSNGIMHMAFRLLARLGLPAYIAMSVDRAYLGFEDCVPMA